MLRRSVTISAFIGIIHVNLRRDCESLIYNHRSKGVNFLRVRRKKQTRRILLPLFNKIRHRLLKRLPEYYNIVQTLVIGRTLTGFSPTPNRACDFHRTRLSSSIWRRYALGIATTLLSVLILNLHLSAILGILKAIFKN